MKLMKLLVSLIFLLLLVHGSDAQSEDTDYCIADAQTSEDQLKGTIDWACSNGADCTAIQENEACYFPNTTLDHASYAFNSYYQNMKHNGGSCYFNAAAVLSGVDPSHDSCKFEYVAW